MAINPSTISQAYSTVKTGNTPLAAQSTLAFDSATFTVTNDSSDGYTKVVGSAAAVPLSFALSPLVQGIHDTAALAAVGAVSSGNTTQQSGTEFYLKANATCTGVQFYWLPNTNQSVKCSLWNTTSGVRLANATVSTTGTGLYSVTFGSSVSLVPYTSYTVSVFATSVYTIFAPNLSSSPTGGPVAPRTGGSYLEWIAWSRWAGSDVFPSSIATSERYVADPIFTVP